MGCLLVVYQPAIRNTDPGTSGWTTIEAGIQWFNNTDGHRKYWDGVHIRVILTTADTVPPAGGGNTVLTSGWETYEYTDGGIWSVGNGGPSVVNSVYHSGTVSMRTTASNNWLYGTFTAQSELYARIYWRFATSPPTSGETQFMFIRSGTGNTICAMGLYNDSGTNKWNVLYQDGTWQGWNPSGVCTGASTNTWYCIEMYAKPDTSNGTVQAWINGTLLSDCVETGLNSGVTSGNRIELGQKYSSYTVTEYADDVVVSDSTIGV